MFESLYQCLIEIQFGHAHVCVGHYLQLPSVRDEALKALVGLLECVHYSRSLLTLK